MNRNSPAQFCRSYLLNLFVGDEKTVQQITTELAAQLQHFLQPHSEATRQQLRHRLYSELGLCGLPQLAERLKDYPNAALVEELQQLVNDLGHPPA